MIFPAFHGADRFFSATSLRALIALAALSLCVLPQWVSSPVPAADEWLRDNFIRWHADTAPERRILVVDIDESSLERLPWPWPRARIADMVEVLLQGGARGIALDILQEKPADSDGDARIAMLAAHGPLVLAQMFDFVPREPALRRLWSPGCSPAGS